MLASTNDTEHSTSVHRLAFVCESKILFFTMKYVYVHYQLVRFPPPPKKKKTTSKGTMCSHPLHSKQGRTQMKKQKFKKKKRKDRLDCYHCNSGNGLHVCKDKKMFVQNFSQHKKTASVCRQSKPSSSFGYPKHTWKLHHRLSYFICYIW